MRHLRPMRRVTRIAGLVVAATVGVGALTGAPAGAAELSDAGWWWRANAGDKVEGVGPAPDVGLPQTAPAPPPPGVPEGGLLVARDPDGAHAMGAVRFALAAGEENPVLTLKVAGGNGAGEGDVLACSATSAWAGEHGGRWDSRPLAECDAARGGASVAGVPAGDGSSWTFDLASLVRAVAGGGEVDVAIVPAVDPDAGAYAPFELRFDTVDTGALAVDAAVVEAESSAGAGPDVGVAPSPETFASGPTDELAVAPVGPAAEAAPFSLPPVEPLVVEDDIVLPEVQVQTSSAPTSGDVAAPRLRPAVPASASDTTAQTVAMGVLLGGAILLVLAGRRHIPVPAALGRAMGRPGGGATGAEPHVGGLGRFARPRRDPPDPL